MPASRVSRNLVDQHEGAGRRSVKPTIQIFCFPSHAACPPCPCSSSSFHTSEDDMTTPPSKTCVLPPFGNSFVFKAFHNHPRSLIRLTHHPKSHGTRRVRFLCDHCSHSPKCLQASIIKEHIAHLFFKTPKPSAPSGHLSNQDLSFSAPPWCPLSSNFLS